MNLPDPQTLITLTLQLRLMLEGTYKTMNSECEGVFTRSYAKCQTVLQALLFCNYFGSHLQTLFRLCFVDHFSPEIAIFLLTLIAFNIKSLLVHS